MKLTKKQAQRIADRDERLARAKAKQKTKEKARYLGKGE